MKKATFSYACNPMQETPVERHTGAFSSRFAYARAAETKRAGDRGQDYLTCAEVGDSFVFALCDGVSLSFCGDIAAQILAVHLRDWLLDEERRSIVSIDMLRSQLTAELQALTSEATEAVNQLPLPPEVSGLLRDVLEEKRLLGSETTFVCGRVDLPSPIWPEGRLLLAWMGDSRLRLWGDGIEWSSSLPGEFRTAERWSTRRGLVGTTPHVFVSGLTKHAFTHLAAYSDGFAALDVWEDLPDDRTLQAVLESSFRKPTSDDVSLIDLRWELTQVEAHFAEEERETEGLLARLRKLFERR